MNRNLTGVWNADLSESRFLGPAPKEITVKILYSDPELEEEMLVTRQDGSVETAIFKCRTDSQEDTSLLNGKTMRGTARWIGEHLVIESWIQAGERSMHLCDYWSLSSDGETLSMEHRDDSLAGQRTVLHRT